LEGLRGFLVRNTAAGDGDGFNIRGESNLGLGDGFNREEEYG